VVRKPRKRNNPASQHHPIVMTILVMGVSGSGKSTLAKALAARLGGRYLEADDFHPQSNKEKMASGRSLDDADRMPWLHAIRGALAARCDDLTPTVLACSALKEKFRDILREGDPDLRVVFLEGDREVIRQRLEARQDHFMPSSLVDPQFEVLEPPCDAARVPVNLATDAQIAFVLHDFGLER
jgi:gluconokinase